MSHTSNDVKLDQFNEFFSIEHPFHINIVQLNNHSNITYTEFITHMPTPFKLANDINTLDQAALAPLGTLSGVAAQLVQYLNHQTQKIDLLVNHILSEQDNEQDRYQGIAFGGGGIEFVHDTAFTLNEIIELKIFLTHENCAIYSHAEIINIENINNCFRHKVIFRHIREDDREKLVRSSLHIQSRQLQELAKERNKQSHEE